jgi:hypothetical protein
MFRHISLQAPATEISSYKICQSYWEMYQWQSEHECGTGQIRNLCEDT